jgi:hypothetical protein
MEGRLRIVERSAVLPEKVARGLAAHLQRPKGLHPWPEVITESTLSRFSKDTAAAKKPNGGWAKSSRHWM